MRRSSGISGLTMTAPTRVRPSITTTARVPKISRPLLELDLRRVRARREAPTRGCGVTRCEEEEEEEVVAQRMLDHKGAGAHAARRSLDSARHHRCTHSSDRERNAPYSLRVHYLLPENAPAEAAFSGAAATTTTTASAAIVAGLFFRSQPRLQLRRTRGEPR